MISDRQIKIAKWLLRIGLAFVFIYAAVEIHFHPENFLKYVPLFVSHAVPVNTFLPVFGIGEIILSLWVLSGWHGRVASMICFLILVAIIVPNMAYFSVLFRNVAVALGALALFVLE